MSTYIIGDVQGCYAALCHLLEKISFSPERDQLCFLGDLVNRGPDSLSVLRFIRSLPRAKVVLGNHDLYLLLLGYRLVDASHYHHTLNKILHAPDRLDLLDWLRQQPLVYAFPNQAGVMVHAGIPPQWNLSTALERAQELSHWLSGDHFTSFLTHMLGNHPTRWHDELESMDRLRYICNAFTRMRFCSAEGDLDMKAKQTIPSPEHPDYKPWFAWRSPSQDRVPIFFGHWASLRGQCEQEHCYALDTGCAWGETLTALRLEDMTLINVTCA